VYNGSNGTKLQRKGAISPLPSSRLSFRQSSDSEKVTFETIASISTRSLSVLERPSYL
jgi:hypothetical protein